MNPSKWIVDVEVWVGDGNDLMERWWEVEKTRIKPTYTLKNQTQKDGELKVVYEINVEYDFAYFLQERYRRNSSVNTQLRLKANVTMEEINGSGVPPKIFIWSPTFSLCSHKSVMENINKKSECKETKSNAIVPSEPSSPLISTLYYPGEDESANTSTITTTTTTTQSSEENLEKSASVDTKGKRKQVKRKIEETSDTNIINVQNQVTKLEREVSELRKALKNSSTSVTPIIIEDDSGEIYVPFKLLKSCIKVSKKNPE